MGIVDETSYYEEKFTRDPLWSAREPNSDESARWRAIEPMLRTLPQPPGKILDVGCGRGWLTALAARYGDASGIEPVEEVARHASRLFSGQRFASTPLQQLPSTPGFVPADVVLCSEVIEHVPYARQADFVRQLGAVVRPGGWLILTTPRREMFDRWRWLRRCLPAGLRAEPDQPVEDPLTEQQLRSLLSEHGFCIELHARAYVRYRALSPANAVLGFRAVESLLESPRWDILRNFCHHRWALYQVWRARREA